MISDPKGTLKLEDFCRKAATLGFDGIGVAPYEKLGQEIRHLQLWLQKGCQAGMSYMERNVDKREDPRLLVENAHSLIVTLTNYFHPFRQAEGIPVIARYAYGKDYHKIVKEKLEQLKGQIAGRCFVDSAPVLEHEWARRAGLGWVGKNTLLINREKGSFCFIGIIITPEKFDRYHIPFDKNYCGNCNRCIEACPTGALAPYQLDARKCISYHTIENKGEYPEFVKQKAGERIFGCDICQEVCPWNSRAKMHQVAAFLPSPERLNLQKENWKKMDEFTFARLFKDTPLERTGLVRILRNLSDA